MSVTDIWSHTVLSVSTFTFTCVYFHVHINQINGSVFTSLHHFIFQIVSEGSLQMQQKRRWLANWLWGQGSRQRQGRETCPEEEEHTLPFVQVSLRESTDTGLLLWPAWLIVRQSHWQYNLHPPIDANLHAHGVEKFWHTLHFVQVSLRKSTDTGLLPSNFVRGCCCLTLSDSPLSVDFLRISVIHMNCLYQKLMLHIYLLCRG